MLSGHNQFSLEKGMCILPLLSTPKVLPFIATEEMLVHVSLPY